ncbi:1-phosphofructokinase family hexose kinase [Gracilibacillus sp. YIM 98692]|uniref:1-phosphofructokinase family hexose kinase n=1 Tax=Gracilibacillus sp. YIM 98692 TaxID=2663532 RepID=UPI0013CF44B6|nr:1-phosphofructokinase family hexose kinase [Gracilibacillus sp. YIM 98692]
MHSKKGGIPLIYTVTLNTAIDKVLQLYEPLTRKKNNRIKQVTYDIGGKATHVSVVLSQLNIPNVATGFVGEENGHRLVDMLEDKGVQCHFVSQQGSSTRETIVMVDPSGKGSFMITENGFEVQPSTYQRLLEKLNNRVTSEDIVVFAGSPPIGFTLVQFQELVAVVSKKGAKVVLDVKGDWLKEAIQWKPFMIKPNEYEMEELVGRKLQGVKEYEKQILRLLDKGITYVFVSLGKKGSLVGYKNHIYRVVPPKVQEVNDTGCGDVFVGAVVAGMVQELKVEDMLKRATAMSASKANHDNSSDFSIEQTMNWMEKVEIEKWNIKEVH